jgi:sulfite exporter TauE/SafE
MIAIIEEHNLLNGFRFAILEYLLVGLLLGLLGGWYASVGRPLDAAIWLGITVNCAAVAMLADAQLRAGARDFGTLPFRRAAFRREVLPRHPGLWRRTTALVLLSMTPLALAVLVLAETLRDALSRRVPPASGVEPS